MISPYLKFILCEMRSRRVYLFDPKKIYIVRWNNSNFEEKQENLYSLGKSQSSCWDLKATVFFAIFSFSNDELRIYQL